MKIITFLGLAFVCGSCIGASSCEEKIAEAQGIHTIKDPQNPGHYIVVEDADGGKVGRVLSTAQGAGSGIPVAGQILGALAMLASLSHQVLLARAKARAQEQNAAYDAEVKAHQAANDATNAGLQSFVDAHPPNIGAALIQHLDAAHDDAEVGGLLQDAIQPIPKPMAV